MSVNDDVTTGLYACGQPLDPASLAVAFDGLRQALLLAVDVLERARGVQPTTAEIRHRFKRTPPT